MTNIRKMIEISESCDWCGKCAEICPFGALKIGEGGDIMFRPMSCVEECEVCALSCPMDAIGFSYLRTCGGCAGDCAQCGGCSSHKD